MSTMGRAAILAAHALVGWAFCAAIMGVGIAITTRERTLIIHTIGAPVGFAVVSALYFKKFAFTEPLQTAVSFVLIVMGLDVFVVALLIEHSFAMFRSFLGTWLPFLLILCSTYLTGRFLQRGR